MPLRATDLPILLPVRFGADNRANAVYLFEITPGSPKKSMTKSAVTAFVTVLFGAALTLRAGTTDSLSTIANLPEMAAVTVPAHAAAPMSAAAQNETLQKFCGDCHNDVDMKGEMSLDAFVPARAGEKAELAEKIVSKLRTGLMPPKDMPQPDLATRLALASALETTLDAAAAARPNPGRRPFQRLNRAEYAAAVRALFGLDVDASAYLPADTISAGFDNIADVQMPSATVMQGYMRAAAYVSRAAVGDPSRRIPVRLPTTCRAPDHRRSAWKARRLGRAAALS